MSCQTFAGFMWRLDLQTSVMDLILLWLNETVFLQWGSAGNWKFRKCLCGWTWCVLTLKYSIKQMWESYLFYKILQKAAQWPSQRQSGALACVCVCVCVWETKCRWGQKPRPESIFPLPFFSSRSLALCITHGQVFGVERVKAVGCGGTTLRLLRVKMWWVFCFHAKVPATHVAWGSVFLGWLLASFFIGDQRSI